jgi:hypothetical protein
MRSVIEVMNVFLFYLLLQCKIGTFQIVISNKSKGETADLRACEFKWVL